MKKYILSLLAFAVAALQLCADTVVRKDGTTFEAYNVEEAGKWLLYTLEPGPDGALQRVLLDEIAQVLPSKTQQDAEGTRPASENDSLVALYNAGRLSLRKAQAQPGKLVKEFVAVWGVAPGSVLSDSNITVSFRPQVFAGSKLNLFYKIRIDNKTDKPVYIDLARTVRIDACGKAHPLYDRNAVKEEKRKANVSVQSATNPVLVIEPHSAVYLPGRKLVDGDRTLEFYELMNFRNKTFDPWFEEYKTDRAKCLRAALDVEGSLDEGTVTLHAGEYIEKTAADTPKSVKRLITYSTDPEMKNAVVLPVEMYIRGLFGSCKPDKWAPVADSKHLIWGECLVE